MNYRCLPGSDHEDLFLANMRAFRFISVALALGLFVAISTLAAPAGAQGDVAQDNDENVAALNIEVLRSGTGATVVPVRVTVISRRAVEGSLQLRSPNTNVTWELPLALAANSEVQQLFVVPTNGQSSVSLSAALVVDGAEIADDKSGAAIAPVNAVGLIGLSASGAQVQLVPEIGVASLVELDDLSSVAAFDTVVVSPAGLRSLADPELGRLLQWMAAGRQLAVAGDPGSIDAQLPTEWQSSGNLVQAGTGLIRYIGVDWANAVPAGVSSATNSQMAAGWFDPSSDELLNDAGFRVPGLGAMALLLLVYLVLAGPVTFIVLKKMNRQTLAWVVVPGLAVVFAVGVFGVGRVLSSGRGDAFATVVEVSPAGAFVTDSVLIANDGRQTLQLPQGWILQSSGLSTGSGDVGAPVIVAPKRATTELRFDIDTGSGGTAVLRGSSDELVESLTLVDVSLTGETLSGIVVNATGERLENVTVLVGQRLVSVGVIEDGQRGEFLLNLAVNRNIFAPELGTWDVDPRDAWQFGEQRAATDAVSDGPTNGSVWLEWRAARLGTSVPEGMITVVGWSRNLDESLVNGTGRTAVVAHGQLPSAAAPLLPAQIRTMQLLVTGQDRFGEFNDFEAGGSSVVTQFIRPLGADTTQVAVELLGQVSEIEFWSSEGTWRSVKLDNLAGDLSISIPEEVWIDDVVSVRYTFSEFFGEPGQRATRLVTTAPSTVTPELLPAGEDSRRHFDFVEPEVFENVDLVAGLVTPVVFDDNDSFESQGELYGSYDVWQVDVTEGDVLTVRMNADSTFGPDQLDPQLIVRDPSGNRIAENDDFDGLNSGLDFTAEVTGTYDIETRPLGADQGGQYVLRVEAVLAQGDTQ